MNTSTRTVMIKTCPTMNVFHENRPATITIDCGAEADVIRRNVAIALGIKIEKSIHTTTQADGKTPLVVVGEVHTKFMRDGRELLFSALVVETLDVDILGSESFLDRNDIRLWSHKNQLIFSDGTFLTYNAKIKAYDSPPSIRHSTLLRVDETKTLWPGDYMDFPVEDPSLQDSEVAIEPRFSPSAHSWLEPQVTKAVCGVVRLTNSSTEPHTLKKHEHVGELSLTYDPAMSKTESYDAVKNKCRPPHSRLRRQYI